MVFDSQPTKSVPRRVRLAIERNIDVMCRNRHLQSRMQHENLDVRSVGKTRPLREVALSDETCDLTDEDAQEATVRACHSVKHGIIIVGISRKAPKNHFKFCMTLCTCDPDRLRGCTFRGTVLALETLHRSEGGAWLGRDLRQRLDSNLPAMSRARVWTKSFTMAEHIQQESIAGKDCCTSKSFSICRKL